MSTTEALLSVTGLDVTYDSGGRRLRAVRDLAFELGEGETLGLIGESGCGKSTVGRAITRLLPWTATVEGSICFRGQDVRALHGDALKRYRQEVQIIFQDPVSSLNPRRRIANIIDEAMRIATNLDQIQRHSRVRDCLGEVGLDVDAVADRYPHEFSGGQCQRISIARALAVDPMLIVCDEPVSALDVSVQAQILNLLEDLRTRRRLALLFISHDMAVVKNVSDRVMVMYLGRAMEGADGETLCTAPRHPYSRALIASVPTLDQTVSPFSETVLRAEAPSPFAPPPGCPLSDRCQRVLELCRVDWPKRTWPGQGHWLHCHNPAPEAAAVNTEDFQ
ncbi:ABC transporter ATP-binding protein [Sphingomonas sp.]|uniref:ABC transporter ATP-binding protein n=1 Tax=Sphingomonas sp. TaxID=28214 RepID=UPI0025FCE003|nr:ABC transporter ATP-binding protein [Sphingomonas sp.]